jgi:hypothetical protein
MSLAERSWTRCLLLSSYHDETGFSVLFPLLPLQQGHKELHKVGLLGRFVPTISESCLPRRSRAWVLELLGQGFTYELTQD